MQLLTEVRSIVKAHDLDTFDTIVLGQEVEAIKVRRNSCKENNKCIWNNDHLSLSKKYDI